METVAEEGTGKISDDNGVVRSLLKIRLLVKVMIMMMTMFISIRLIMKIMMMLISIRLMLANNDDDDDDDKNYINYLYTRIQTFVLKELLLFITSQSEWY